jgi:hypothetical protein
MGGPCDLPGRVVASLVRPTQLARCVRAQEVSHSGCRADSCPAVGQAFSLTQAQPGEIRLPSPCEDGHAHTVRSGLLQTAEMRLFGSVATRPPSALRCYRCLRYEPLPMCPERAERPWRPREDSRAAFGRDAQAQLRWASEPLTLGLGNCTRGCRGALSAFWRGLTWQSVANRVLAGPSGSYRRSNSSRVLQMRCACLRSEPSQSSRARRSRGTDPRTVEKSGLLRRPRLATRSPLCPRSADRIQPKLFSRARGSAEPAATTHTAGQRAFSPHFQLAVGDDAEGWTFDTMQFAMRDSSKRPAMAFLAFTHNEDD